MKLPLRTLKRCAQVLAFFAMLCASRVARADDAAVPKDIQDALKGLKTADADGRQKTYQLITDKGDARLIPALKAYKDGSLLLSDDRLEIYGERVEVAGKGSVVPVLNALTGEPVKGADGQLILLPKLDLHNAIKGPPRSERSTINDLISALSLLDPDPTVRLQSIRDIGERASRAFINADDAAADESALKACSAALKDSLAKEPPGDTASTTDALAAIDAVLAERPVSPIVSAPSDSAATRVVLALGKVKLALPTTVPAKPVQNSVTDAINATQTYRGDIDVQAKVLDDLTKYRPLLQKQLDKDPTGRYAKALHESLTEIAAVQSDGKDRIAAAEALGQIGTTRAANVLEKLQKAARRIGDADLEKAATTSLAAVNSYQNKISFVQNTFAGLSAGSILVLLALGLSIIFGLMGVINMAHGEFMMVGAFTTFVVSQGFKHLPPSLYNFYPIAAIPAAFLVAGLVGLLCEAVVVRRLYGRPLETLLATWGISLILIQCARGIFGDNLSIKPPTWMEGGVEVLPDLTFGLNRIYIICYCGICIATVYYIVNRTKLGLLLRATTQNRDMASALGVPTRRIDAITFAIGAGLAGLAGVAVPMYDKINPGMGQDYVVDSFMVVVVGGVGKLAGVIWSGLGLGFISKYLEAIFEHVPMLASGSSVICKVVVLFGIVAFLQWRPAGLFPPKGRNADA